MLESSFLDGEKEKLLKTKKREKKIRSNNQQLIYLSRE